MIIAILIVILVLLCTVFNVPFWDFLVPSENIVLADIKTNQILAKGIHTLWYQWQLWLITLALILVAACIVDLIRESTNKGIAEKSTKLDKEIEHYQQLQRTFKDKKQKEVWSELQYKQDELNEIKTDIEQKYHDSQQKLKAANELNKTTNISNRAQDKKVRSKNKQRDRLSSQKKMIITYLDDQNFTVGNEKLTYKHLLKLAQQYENEQS